MINIFLLSVSEQKGRSVPSFFQIRFWVAVNSKYCVTFYQILHTKRYLNTSSPDNRYQCLTDTFRYTDVSYFRGLLKYIKQGTISRSCTTYFKCVSTLRCIQLNFYKLHELYIIYNNALVFQLYALNRKPYSKVSTRNENRSTEIRDKKCELLIVVLYSRQTRALLFCNISTEALFD